MNTTTTTDESDESPSEPTACAGTCGGVYARGTEMVLLWQRHATAQGLVTRQDAFCFRCALQDLSDQIQKLKAEREKQADTFIGDATLLARWKQWRESAETADATTSVAEVAS